MTRKQKIKKESKVNANGSTEHRGFQNGGQECFGVNLKLFLEKLSVNLTYSTLDNLCFFHAPPPSPAFLCHTVLSVDVITIVFFWGYCSAR